MAGLPVNKSTAAGDMEGSTARGRCGASSPATPAIRARAPAEPASAKVAARRGRASRLRGPIAAAAKTAAPTRIAVDEAHVAKLLPVSPTIAGSIEKNRFEP